MPGGSLRGGLGSLVTDPRVEADIERVNKLARQCIENLYRDAEEDEIESFRVDQFGIVGVAAITDEDGDDAEGYFSYFETKRPSVKMGILFSVIIDALRRKL